MRSLPCVEYVLTRLQPPTESGLLIIQHLLRDTEEFVWLISSRWNVVGIIGIPYSAKNDVIQRLKRCFLVVVPQSVEEMESAISHILSTLRNPTLVLDVGGYCAGLATTAGLPIAGIVEETRQGHWRYERVEKDLRYPVLSIAQSRAKQIEHLAVGPSIVFSFDKILRDELKDSLQGKNAVVLGYGSVGRSVAWTLRGVGATVMVFDIDPACMIEAKLAGFHVGPKADLLRVADVVFGVAGRQSLGQTEFELLRSGVYLVSGSSRRIEFDVAALEATGFKERVSDSLTKFRFKNKEIILVNDGLPVKFRDNSIPMAITDLVFAEILLALETITSRPPGFYADYMLNGEDAMLRHWLHSYLNFEL